MIYKLEVIVLSLLLLQIGCGIGIIRFSDIDGLE